MPSDRYLVRMDTGLDVDFSGCCGEKLIGVKRISTQLSHLYNCFYVTVLQVREAEIKLRLLLGEG